MFFFDASMASTWYSHSMLVFLKQLEIKAERHGVSMCFALSIGCRGCLPKFLSRNLGSSTLQKNSRGLWWTLVPRAIRKRSFLMFVVASRFGCFLDIVWDNFVLGTYANVWDDSCPGQLDYGRYKDAISGFRHPCQSITYRIYPYCLPPLNIASSSLCKDVAAMLCYMFSCVLQMKQIAYGPWGCVWNFEKQTSISDYGVERHQ